MGPVVVVVVVVVVVLLLFKTLAQDLLSRRDPTPKKVLYAKSAPMSDRSWRGSRLSSGWDP